MDVIPILSELPIEEADRKILESLLKKPDGSMPPLESLSETGAKVLINLAINKVRKIVFKKYKKKVLNLKSYFFL